MGHSDTATRTAVPPGPRLAWRRGRVRRDGAPTVGARPGAGSERVADGSLRAMRLPMAWRRGGDCARIVAGLALLVLPLAGCAGVGAHAGGGATPRSAGPSGTGTSPSQDGVSRWRPGVGLSWQWQLTTPVDTSVRADVYDIDADENPASLVDALHRAGRRVVCYVNAGSWEPYRPDAGMYPKVLLGKALDGWPDERWLDIRRLDLLTPLLAHRLDECRAKGFDGVEPDNVDGYANDTGFPLTAADQLAFDRAVARLAHQRGLAVGLKNDFDQVAALQPDFDYGVDEQCAELNTCAVLSAFVSAGRPVFDAEYAVPTSGFCAQTRRLGISAIRKHLELDAWRQTC